MKNGNTQSRERPTVTDIAFYKDGVGVESGAPSLKAPKDKEMFMIITNIYGVLTMCPSPVLST